MKIHSKLSLFTGSVFIVLALAAAGCSSMVSNTTDDGSSAGESDIGAVDSSLIDEIESQTADATLTGQVIENTDLGIKLTCPGTEDEGWSCNSDIYGVSAMHSVDGFGVGGVIVSVMTVAPSLEDANDLFTGIYSTDTHLGVKSADSYIATYLSIESFGSTTRKLIYMKELAPSKYLQCVADSYLNEENFDYIAAQAAKLCLSVENL
ncbi:MAG: hypothetical protein ABIH78_03065 [Candidatus Peregrinibacteria bacterium]